MFRAYMSKNSACNVSTSKRLYHTDQLLPVCLSVVCEQLTLVREEMASSA